VKRIVLYDASAIDRPTREDLHRLVSLRLAARRDGCDLVLTGVGRRLHLLLELTGLDEVFAISPETPPIDQTEQDWQTRIEQARAEQTEVERPQTEQTQAEQTQTGRIQTESNDPDEPGA
jgi:hypothetical protein